MGCGGSRDKGPPEHTQKWEYITLSDFKSTSSWNTIAYIWLWAMAMIAVAVYAVDTLTAVNLLIYNRWSSQIQPAVPFKYSKWIFAICILLSWALCIYEWLRAIRVIRRGGVAESYLNPLAVTLQSMRGSGWRRFLVFSELTKSKKGADYVALFVFFAFKGAIRVILAEGPRQAVNAMSLYAVMNAELVPHGRTDISNFEQFWVNLGDMANHNKFQALIFFSMLFTLSIWVFSALSLIAAAVLYILFLWHYIPQVDGRLSIYCRRKIDRRLEKIVEHKIIAANEEEERNRVKYAKKIEALQLKSGDTGSLAPPKLIRAPTLPQIGDSPDLKTEQSSMGLTRQNTNASVATLPQYSSRPPTRNGAGSMAGAATYDDTPGARPSLPSMPTQGSNVSYASDAPLLANTGFPGDEYRGVPTGPTGPPAPAYNRQGPMRPRFGSQSTLASQRSFTPGPPRDGLPGGYRMGTPGPLRNGTPGPDGQREPGSVRNGAPGPLRNGTPGPLRNGTPGPLPNGTSGMPSQGYLGAVRNGPYGLPRNGTPGPPFQAFSASMRDGTPDTLRHGTPGPNQATGDPDHGPPPASHESETSNVPPSPAPVMPTPNTVAGFDFGITPAIASHEAPTRSMTPAQPVYKPLVLQPVNTWQKAYDDPPAVAPANFTRPFSGRTSQDEHVPSSPESYELKTKPVHSSPINPPPAQSGNYVAFNPTRPSPAMSPPPAEHVISPPAVSPIERTKTPTRAGAPDVHIGEPSPIRSVSNLDHPTEERPVDYFSFHHTPSSTPTTLGVPSNGDNRLTVLGYGDILDEYGAGYVPTPSGSDSSPHHRQL